MARTLASSSSAADAAPPAAAAAAAGSKAPATIAGKPADAKAFSPKGEYKPEGPPYPKDGKIAEGFELKIPASPKVLKLVDDFMELTIAELVAFNQHLTLRLGMKPGEIFAMRQTRGPAGGAGAPTAGDAAAAAAPKAEEKKAAPAPAAEKTSFDVKLEGFEPNDKVKVIKEVRAITSLGLKEAKDLVESAPKVIAPGLTKADAEAMVEKLKAAGARVSLV